MVSGIFIIQASHVLLHSRCLKSLPVSMALWRRGLTDSTDHDIPSIVYATVIQNIITRLLTGVEAATRVVSNASTVTS